LKKKLIPLRIKLLATMPMVGGETEAGKPVKGPLSYKLLFFILR
jgi:hypothetical protein